MIATENIPLKDFKRIGIEPIRFAKEYKNSMQSLLRHGRTALIPLKLRLIDNSDFHLVAKLEFEIENDANPSLVIIQPTATIQSAWKLSRKDLDIIAKGTILVKGTVKNDKPIFLYQLDPEVNDIVRVKAELLPVPITPSNLMAIEKSKAVKLGDTLFNICLWKPNFIR